MSPHEESAHLASAFRQLNSEVQRLQLVEKIRLVAIGRLKETASLRTADLKDPDVAVHLQLDVNLDVRECAKDVKRKARFRPS